MSNILNPRYPKETSFLAFLASTETRESPEGTLHAGELGRLATHLSGMQEHSSVPLVAWPRSTHSHLNETTRENWSARGPTFRRGVLRTCATGRILVHLGPRFRDGRLLSVRGRGTGRRGWHRRQVARFGHFQVNSDARVVKSARARRGHLPRRLAAHIRTPGPRFSKLPRTPSPRHCWRAPTSRQMAASSGCTSVRHLAGGFEWRRHTYRSDQIARAATTNSMSSGRIDVPTHRAIVN